MLKNCSSIIILLFTLVSSQGLFALSSKSHEFVGNELKEITTHIDQEQEKWIVQSFSRTATSLPERVSYHVLGNYYEALALYNKSSSFQQSKEGSVFFGNLPIATTEVKSRKLWRVENTWDDSWEERFSDWVFQEIDLEFFRRYGLSVDCADVGLSLRWIFSFIHKLPVANSLTSNGQLVTHETFKRSYLGLKESEVWHENEVLLAAIKYLNKSANTKSLINDLYPAAVSRDFIRSGTIYMTKGHVRIVKSITDDGSNYPLEFTYGTVPASLNVYREYFFLGANQPDRNHGGFLNFRWPIFDRSLGKWVLEAEENMSGYSLEQYKPLFHKKFYQQVFKTLNLVIKPKSIIKSIASNMKELLDVRKDIVRDGYEQCLNFDCHEQSELYDEWSTPSRDKRVYSLFKSLKGFSLNYKLNDLRLEQLKLKKISVLNQEISLLDLEQYFRYKLISGDPRAPIGARWGINHSYVAKAKREKIMKLKSHTHLALNCQQDECEQERVIREIIRNESRLSEFYEELDEYIEICHYSTESSCALHRDKELLNLVLNPYRFLDNSKLVAGHSGYSIVPKFERSVEQAETNILIIDHKKVFDIKKSMFIFQSMQTHSLYYLKKYRKWIELTIDDSMNLYDDSFKRLYHQKLGDDLTHKKIRLITESHFFLNLCGVGKGCSYELYSFDAGKLKKEREYSSGITLRLQTIDSVRENNLEGVCFKDYISKKDDCYFQEGRQTKKLSLDISDSITLFFNSKILSHYNSQLRLTDSHTLSFWNTGITGRISNVFEGFQDVIFVTTHEKEKNCHLLNFKAQKRLTMTCPAFIAPYISPKLNEIYVQNSDGKWTVNNGLSSWKNLGGSGPLGFSEQGKLVFESDLPAFLDRFVELSCLSHYETGYYPCHGKSAKFKTAKGEKSFIIKNLDPNFKKSLVWQPSYYRSQQIKLLEKSELIQFSTFHYLIKNN